MKVAVYDKLDSGYQVVLEGKKRDTLLLRAMNGYTDYLVRYDENVLEIGTH